MSINVSNCQHCDEQDFKTLSCVHYTIISVVKLDLFIRALLLDRILALEKTTRTSRVHLVDIEDMLNILIIITLRYYAEFNHVKKERKKEQGNKRT